MLKGGYAWLARPFCYFFFVVVFLSVDLQYLSVRLPLNLSETPILSRLLLSCLSLNMSLDRNGKHTNTRQKGCSSILLNTYLYTVHADKSNSPSASHPSNSSIILSSD